MGYEPYCDKGIVVSCLIGFSGVFVFDIRYHLTIVEIAAFIVMLS